LIVLTALLLAEGVPCQQPQGVGCTRR
jgi:hypothetical protein